MRVVHFHIRIGYRKHVKSCVICGRKHHLILARRAEQTKQGVLKINLRQSEHGLGDILKWNNYRNLF